MCLGIPGRVIAMAEGYGGQIARVDVEGVERRINVGILDRPPSPGDWVVIHMGFAMETVSEPKAREAREGLQLVGSGPTQRVRRELRVSGVVQGVGFRPFVYAAAAALGLAGSVRNDVGGVVVEVEGDAADVDEMVRRLRSEPPPLALIADITERDLAPQGATGFHIDESTADGLGRTLGSPDVAMCADCERELTDPSDRRYRHPFITCTNCGPRFTITTDLPYDRANTTMAGFPMCERCAREYADPADRRFHAQPIACPDCGPVLTLVTPAGSQETGAAALAVARSMLSEGKILGIKGIGGYHLACDARDADAVALLRRRKARRTKPFAVMVRDLVVARRLTVLDPAAEAVLTGPRHAILLVPRGRGAGEVAASVAPNAPDLGIFLPYTPLHRLLFGLDGDEPGPDVLVMTSGNRSGEPIVTDDGQAAALLAPLADAWLTHDRGIVVPCDDSVTRFVSGVEVPIRRSRGYAPLPIALPFDVEPTLAVGADLKCTCGIGVGRFAWISQHIGDVDTAATIEALAAASDHLAMITGVVPTRLVVDEHPAYRSAQWARSVSRGRPVVGVQHHHAHIASVMGEHGVPAGREVIGIAFDGTGYGTDGGVWGGELLVADYAGFDRLGQLAYVPLAGGDVSVRRPYRMAMAHLHHAGLPWSDGDPAVAACPPDERRVLAHQLDTGLGCVPTSSMGRLFDAVASLAGVCQRVDYEAEAAIELEGAAREVEADRPYRFAVAPVGDSGRCQADPAPLIAAVVDDVRSGVPTGMIAARFHRAVADLIVEFAARARVATGLETVALGGGVFQNTVLLELATRALSGVGFEVLRPALLPANDGGIALGQILVAQARAGATCTDDDR
ncbi:carbamoyltransferase HypF [Tsukamurella soli]|uniref:acylphosphatase n=1 Tax=Tsukamurella soli TaxID=644556 RepID=A0ABP8JF25_9ACTN